MPFERGVAVVMGTDSSRACTRRPNWRHVAVRPGAVRAIQAATIEGAKLLGLADQIGTLEAGKQADLIAVSGDPLADPELWRDPAESSFVMQGGPDRGGSAARRDPVIFFWAARVIDAWLGLPRGLRAVWARPSGRPDGPARDRACGIPSVGREVRIADITAIVLEHPAAAHYLDHQWIPVHAQTLGRYVFARERLSDRTIAHEMEHVRQWERLGPAVPAAYAASSVWRSCAAGRLPGQPFEEAARRQESMAPAGRSLGDLDGLWRDGLQDWCTKGARMVTRVQVVFDCADPAAQAEFWHRRCHYRMPDPPGGFHDVAGVAQGQRDSGGAMERWLRQSRIPTASTRAFSSRRSPKAKSQEPHAPGPERRRSSRYPGG